MTQNFILQFDATDIPKYAALYSFAEDEEAMAAGRRIAGGEHSRENLTAIFNWKTKGRGISRIARNADDEISDALHLAMEAKTDRMAVAVLVGLQGVDVPVASAILTATNQTRFTIIDYRALGALGVRSVSPSITLYLSYLKACRDLAAQNRLSLRELDRALWQWHKTARPA